MKVENNKINSALPIGWTWQNKGIGSDGEPIMIGLPSSIDDIDAEWALSMIHKQLINHNAYGESRVAYKKRLSAEMLARGKSKEEIESYWTRHTPEKDGGHYLPEKPSPRAEDKRTALIARLVASGMPASEAEGIADLTFPKKSKE